MQKADGIIAVSQFTGDLTNKILNINNLFAVVPNSVDIHDFKIINEGKISNSNQFDILYFGNLIRKKGALELPFIFNKVIERMPDAKLSLAGKDILDFETGISTWQMMQPLFSEKAILNVNYLGSVEYDEIQNIINQTNVCVFPSFAEALPVSWLESMSMQKAIVASNIGWANEMIEDGKSGYLVHPKDHNKFALRIIELLENPNLIVSFGRNARIKIEKDFSNQVVTAKSVAFYNQIIIK